MTAKEPDLPNSIRKLREAEGLTQQQLGEMVGADKSIISKLETGKLRGQMDLMSKVGRALGHTIEELMATPAMQRSLPKDKPRSQPTAFGLSEDAEPYTPPKTSLLVRSETIKYVRMTSDILQNHPLKISTDDVLAFDLSPEKVSEVRSEQVVLVQLILKADTHRTMDIVREFIRPGLLVTNSDRNNHVISLSDETLPYKPVIKGVFRSMTRE